MKKHILFLIFIACSLLLNAQVKVSGIVTDSNLEPLPGVSIVIKSTKKGTTTDLGGHYTINVNKGDILTFSVIGMIKKDVNIKSEGKIDVILEYDVYSIDEVVAIGYGSSKKSDLTGSVVSIKPEKLANKVGMVSSSLQGLAAGVLVTQGNMKPGADASIVIRGSGTLKAGNEPLYIVDGVPVQGGLQDLSASDIESIEILKDASSSSIYGSRASNGVILISTKKGTKGKSKISFNVSNGFQTMLNKQKLMNAQQYYELSNSVDPNYKWTSDELRLLSSGGSTDWQDAVTQKGNYQNYNFSLSGGNEKSSQFLGIDWYNQKGTIKNSSFNKGTIRYNMDSKINEWLNSGIRFNVIESALSNINEETDPAYGTMFSAISSQPTAPIFTDNGEYFDGFLNTKANPVAIVDLLDRITKKTRMVGSVYFELEPIKNLKLRSDNGGELVFYKVNQYEDGRMGQHYTKDGHANIMSNKKRYWQTENTATYNLKHLEHKLTILGGFSASRTDYEEVTADSKGLNSILKYNNLWSAKEHGPNGSFAASSTLASFYGRLMYNYNERYLATFTMRADGSSRFAPGHRWGYFPSLAGAWRISEEDFMKGISKIDNLKLRVSAGMLGNQNIGDYRYMALVSQGGEYNNYILGNELVTGATFTSILNPDLTWEKAKQLDFGIDFGFFGNKLNGSIEAYYKRTNDLLWDVPLPSESGYTNSLTNVGIIDNKGFEFSINSLNVSNKSFQWTTSFNLSLNRNELVELYDGKQDVGKYLFVGHSIGEYYTLKNMGIWQQAEVVEAAKYNCEPGDRKVFDRDNNGSINGDDRNFSGQSVPVYFGSLSNTFKYSGFDFVVFLTYAGGHKINNSLNRFLNSYNTWGNMSEEYYNNYWRLDRPSNIYPKPRPGSPYANGDGTDANLQDGKYLRVKNIEFGYTLPNHISKTIKSSNIRCYFAVQNLHTFTAFTGFDVESFDNTNPYPAARGYIGGLSINF